MAVRKIERVIVSTDSPEIAAIAHEYGAEIPFMRPLDLAEDHTPEWFAWRHALTYLKKNEGFLPDPFISIPTTAPLRKAEDIERCIAEYDKGGADMVITTTVAHRNPYFNMVKDNLDGSVELIVPSRNPVIRRQEVPLVYDMTTVCYVGNPQYIIEKNSIFEGRVRSVHIPPERAVDIDTILDFKIAEFIATQFTPE
jgi:CMP-N-acetylneuraminic acid synthetase